MKHVKVLLAAGILGLGIAVVPVPAQAASCPNGTNGPNGAWVSCNTGSSGYRAVVICRYYIPTSGSYAYDTEFGSVQYGGRIAYAQCLPGWSRSAYYYITGI